MAKQCIHCGNEFDSIRNTKRFCSRRCCKQHANAQIVSTMEERPCLFCGEVFKPKYITQTKYCSESCTNKYSHKFLHTLKKNICVDCGEAFLAQRSDKNRCVECHRKHLIQNVRKYQVRRDPLIRIGIGMGNAQKRIDLPKGFKNPKSIKDKLRKQILRKRWYVCDLCSPKKVLKSSDLEIHHLDMDRRNNTDANIMVLCTEHHDEIHSRTIKLGKLFGGITVELCKRASKEIEAETKSRNEAEKSYQNIGQSEPKASRDISQGQRIPAGEDLPSADTRPRHLFLGENI